MLYDREEAAGGEFRNQAGGDADKEMTDLLVEALRSIEAPDEQLVRLGVELDTTAVEILKLESTDGFIAFDLGDAPAVGIVRQAPKVLRDGAELLARSTTYAAASFGLQIGGGSAGLNAKPDDRDAALAAFLEEVAPLVESGRWLPGPGVGIQADDLSSLPRAEDRAVAFDQTTAGESAVAAALGALGSLDGKRVAHRRRRPDRRGGRRVGRRQRRHRRSRRPASTPSATRSSSPARPACSSTTSPPPSGPRSSCRSPPVPVTARALAVLGRAGRRRRARLPVHGRAAARRPRPGRWRRHDPRPRRRWRRSPARAPTSGWPPSTKAEDHLRTWQDELPFGRPLACAALRSRRR